MTITHLSANCRNAQTVPAHDAAPSHAAAILLATALLAIAAHARPAFAEPTAKFALAGHRLVAEVADTDAARLRGLMFRTRLAPDHGMLFVFDRPAAYCMWMRNTRLPLSVAFLDPRGAVINIEAMMPQTDDTHCARRPAGYALEMTQGWFAAHGIREGAVLTGGLSGLSGLSFRTVPIVPHQ